MGRRASTGSTSSPRSRSAGSGSRPSCGSSAACRSCPATIRSSRRRWPMATDDDTVGMATETVERGHEARDADVRVIFAVGGGLAAVTLLVIVVLYFQVEALWPHRRREVPPPPPVASALPEAPPEPRLQTEPALDLRALRAAEDARLHGTGWVDREAGVVHIPIE